ncbi:MAG: hypothetical protein QMD09_10685, partial [Desulfatibacillaceae bacterium]|nr:hypothetical protein [Desulfatibacillaceae bacterium]
MSTLVTLVGQQPGAVATTGLTLIKNKGLSSIVLVPTLKTMGQAKKLKKFFAEFPGVQTKIQEPETAGNNTQGLTIVDIIRGILGSAPQGEVVYYDTTPGLNFMVARISKSLVHEKDLVFLYSDNETLYRLDGQEEWPKESIGLDTLLKLHSLNRSKGYCIDEAMQVYAEVIISGGKEPLNTLAVCEQRGQLHVLEMVLKETNQNNDESHRVKQEARIIESFANSPVKLNYLRPVFAVVTNDSSVCRRLEDYGIHSLYEKINNIHQASSPTRLTRIINNWIDGLDMPPKYQDQCSDSDCLVLGDSPIYSISSPDLPWEGPPLLLCLGTDPSATLIALFTHKPGKAIILTDRHSPKVRSVAGRILACREEIFAGELIFWPVDMLGNALKKDDLVATLQRESWHANISPGTKVQAFAMARLPAYAFWSMRNDIQKAVDLFEDADKAPLHYDFPPVDLWGEVCGGLLQNRGADRKSLAEKSLFLKSMADVVAMLAENGNLILPETGWRQGLTLEANIENFIRCDEVDAQKNRLSFTVCLNGNEQTGSLPGPADQGLWLEEVIAGAFLAAGAEKITDIRAGMRWAWSKKQTKKFKTDIDIAMIWKGSKKGVAMGVSCKLVVPKDKLEEARAEIVAEARANFGRFALPVLVRGHVDRRDPSGYARKRINENKQPLEIDLSLLNKTGILAELVDAAISKQRT